MWDFIVLVLDHCLSFDFCLIGQSTHIQERLLTRHFVLQECRYQSCLCSLAPASAVLEIQ